MAVMVGNVNGKIFYTNNSGEFVLPSPRNSTELSLLYRKVCINFYRETCNLAVLLDYMLTGCS